ncbi:MAG TPA: hypothetical protein VG652_00010 [Gaiellaceae bacterium]|nr:hypothetical protein [Gaiellaceae bacterium]
MFLRTGTLAAVISVGLLASCSFAFAGQRAATSCSTKGLAFSAGKNASYKVVQLGAEGVACSKARTIAQKLALQLLHGKPVSIDGVSGLAMSTLSIGSGPAKTQVSLTYSNKGKITVSLSGSGAPSSGTQIPNDPFPADPFPSDPFPSIPSPSSPSPSSPSSGNGHTITV